MESMTQAPYLLPGARAGYRIGDENGRRLHDVRRPVRRLRPRRHGRWRPSSYSQQASADHAGSARTPSPPPSHERAAAAIKDGRFADEIVPVSVPQRKGDPIVVDTDEGVRPGTTVESLGELRPAFAKDGTITAGNASQISDGGAAVIVMSAGARPTGSASRRSARSSATARWPARTRRC